MVNNQFVKAKAAYWTSNIDKTGLWYFSFTLLYFFLYIKPQITAEMHTLNGTEMTDLYNYQRTQRNVGLYIYIINKINKLGNKSSHCRLCLGWL